jgi:2,4-dienoyl-CoA reductase (NADPH2)
MTDIDVRCRTRLVAIHDTAVSLASGKDSSAVFADTVVLAVGAKPEDRLYRELEGKVPELYAVGDCVSPRKMIEAIHEGYAVASAV